MMKIGKIMMNIMKLEVSPMTIDHELNVSWSKNGFENSFKQFEVIGQVLSSF